MSRAMSRNSVIVFVSNSAIFTLCRASSILGEAYAHAPFCIEPGGSVAAMQLWREKNYVLSVGRTGSLWKIPSKTCGDNNDAHGKLQEVSAKVSITCIAPLSHIRNHRNAWLVQYIPLELA